MAITKQKSDVDYEDRRDVNLTYMLVGWLCWIFGFLVMFFNPSAMRLGRISMLMIAVVLAVVGLVLNLIGWIRLKRA
jgi:energy-converting hydrogenase Eha subunit G